MAENTPEVPRGEVRIHWYIPDDLVSRYATNFIVQHGEHEFILSFFDIQLPILLGPSTEVKTQIEQLRSVRANCVGQIIIAAERMPELIRILQENLQTYLSKQEVE
jgi:uncharacterized protein DUF3467